MLEQAEVVVKTIQFRKKNRLESDSNGFNKATDRKTKVYCTSFDSRIGRIYIASTDKGVCKVSVPKETRKDFFDWIKQRFDLDDVVDDRSHNREGVEQLNR